MPLYQATVAKNNQKVSLSLQQNSKEDAREYLHAQGYSILSIDEVREALVDAKKSKSFFFIVRIQGQEKRGQINSLDILSAYKKLTEDLSYEVRSIYEDVDSNEEEIAYSTARAKQAYLELKERTKNKIIQTQQKDWTEEWSSEKLTVLEKEVARYQLLLEKIYIKLITLVSDHSVIFWEDRSAKIATLAAAIKQARQITNINKLKIIGEETLLKIWALELEIVDWEHEENKKKFIAETNMLLRGIGSSSRVSVGLAAFEGKLKTLKDEIFWSSISPEKTAEIKDKTSFAYFKSLKELSVYEEWLKMIKKELLALIFVRSEKKARLSLKKKLLEQNILILQSRVKWNRFSYTRIIKWLFYYNDLLILTFNYLASASIFFLAGAVASLWILRATNLNDSFNLNVFIFWFCLIALFGFLFKGLSKITSLLGAFFIYAIIIFALSINF
jgi:DNA-dependent RNA polymerase auxiliary subunit epsilon